MKDPSLEHPHNLRSALLLLVFFCFIHNAALAETIFSARVGPFNLPKDADEKKISVQYGDPISEELLIQEHKHLKIVPITNFEGQKFACILPNITDGDGKRIKDEEVSDTGDVAGLRKTNPETLLDVMKNVQCSYLLEGWWTYEFCYKRHIRQFHAEISVDENGNAHKVETQSFFLGKYDEEKSRVFQSQHGKNFFQRSPKSQTATMRYQAHIYTNGTKCDLTQVERQTEVRFICADTHSMSIKESPSCKYTLMFSTPLLCRHVAFREISTTGSKILCRPLEEKNEAMNEEA